jgi:hypothetical protein
VERSSGSFSMYQEKASLSRMWTGDWFATVDRTFRFLKAPSSTKARIGPNVGELGRGGTPPTTDTARRHPHCPLAARTRTSKPRRLVDLAGLTRPGRRGHRRKDPGGGSVPRWRCLTRTSTAGSRASRLTPQGHSIFRTRGLPRPRHCAEASAHPVGTKDSHIEDLIQSGHSRRGRGGVHGGRRTRSESGRLCRSAAHGLDHLHHRRLSRRRSHFRHETCRGTAPTCSRSGRCSAGEAWKFADYAVRSSAHTFLA